MIVNSRTSEIFEFNKMSFIYFIWITTLPFSLVVFMIEIEKNLKKFKKIKNLVFLYFLFLFIVLVSFVFSIDKYVSFFGYYGRFNGGLLSLLAYISLFFTFYLLYSKKEVILFIKTSFYTSIITSIIAILSKYDLDLLCLLFGGSLRNDCWTAQFNPNERVFGTLGQPNWLAAYLGINMTLGFYLMLTEKRGRKFILYFLSLIILFIGILFSRSTSGLLAILLALLVYLMLTFYQKKVFKKLIVLTSICFLLLLGFGYWKFLYNRITKASNWIGSYLTKNKQKTAVIRKGKSRDSQKPKSEKVTDSFKIRLIVWKGAYELWKKYPILGTGPETFGISYYFTRPIEHNLTSEWDYLYNKAHNEFLNYLATTGVLGFVAYLLISFYPFLLAIKRYKKTQDVFYLSVIAAFIVIHITNFFGFSTTTINLFFFILPAFLLIWEYKEKEQETHYEKQTLKVYIILALPFTLFGLYLLYKMYSADLYYAQGKNYQQIEDYYKSTSYFNKAIKSFYNPIYADKLGYSLANLYYLYKIYQPEKASQYLDVSLKNSALYFSEKAISDSPYNIVYIKNRAKVFFILYQADFSQYYLDQAIRTLADGVRLAPTDPKIYYLYAFLKFIKNKQNKTKLETLLKREINHLIELKPDYPNAHILKSKILLSIYGKERALQYLEDVYKKLESPLILNAKNELEKL